MTSLARGSFSQPLTMATSVSVQPAHEPSGSDGRDGSCVRVQQHEAPPTMAGPAAAVVD